MTSIKQIEANKKNAQKGGVKTIEGKVISSKNSFKHGLTTKQFASLDEKDLYKKVFQSICKDYKPYDMLESILCERIALCYTKLLRIVNIETSEIEKCNLKTELGYLKTITPRSMQEDLYTLEKPKYTTSEDVAKVSEIRKKEKVIYAQLREIESNSLPISMLDSLEKLEGYEARLENRLRRAIKDLKSMQQLRGLVDVNVVENVYDVVEE